MIDIVIMIMTYLVFEKESFPLVHSLTEAQRTAHCKYGLIKPFPYVLRHT